MSKKESVTVLRKMLGNMFDTMYRGAGIESHALAQGMADGYMRALVDLSIMNDAELFKLIQEERRNAAFKADLTTLPDVEPTTTSDDIESDVAASRNRTPQNYA